MNNDTQLLKDIRLLLVHLDEWVETLPDINIPKLDNSKAVHAYKTLDTLRERLKHEN